MTSSFSYSYFGLNCISNVALPLPENSNASSVDIHVDYEQRSEIRISQPYPPFREFRSDARGWLLQYTDGAGDWGAYHYSAADRRIVMMGSAPPENFIPPLLGAVAAVIWRQRGACVLHGAAVEHGGKAIGLLGPSGSGKSTLTAALLARGCRLVSDDVLVLTAASSGFNVFAGHGRLSLDQPTADMLGLLESKTSEPLTRSGSSKLWLEANVAGGGFQPEATRLAGLYVLEPFDPGKIGTSSIALSAGSATIELLQNIYGSDWIAPQVETDLRLSSSLSSQIAVRRLLRNRSLPELNLTAELIFAEGFKSSFS